MSEENLPEYEISPAELQKTLMGFLGHTYNQVSQFDSGIISSSSTLTPKKQEFESLAQKIMVDTIKPHAQQSPQQVALGNIPINGPVQHSPNYQQHNQPAPKIDTNQLEFSFDNSVTALSIDKRLDDIEKRLKRLDIAVSKVLALLETNDPENS